MRRNSEIVTTIDGRLNAYRLGTDSTVPFFDNVGLFREHRHRALWFLKQHAFNKLQYWANGWSYHLPERYRNG